LRPVAVHRADRSRAAPSRAGARRSLQVLALALASALVAPGITRAAPPCNVSVAGTLAFGTYDVFATTALDTSAILTLNCPAGGPTLYVTISKGNSASYAARELRSGSDVLRYNLFLDPGRTQVWGDGTEASSVWYPPKKNAQTTIWGRVPAAQDVAGGSYGDTLVITVFP
jgi:spore coat protein U-like protein